ncbi:hypothetical protein ABC795_01450 [Blastococcus sp. HT6-30]|uniref:hypothetical protein n=1 Tax=Blastococcus sp. HT6-30 TaxID=3144843 RepID=UPI00321AD1C8
MSGFSGTEPAPVTPQGRRGVVVRLARRAGWGVFDQALSSFGNLLLAVLVARAVDVHAFGAFTVAFSVYTIAVQVSRTLVSQPLAIRYAGVPVDEYRAASGLSTGTALAIGLAAAVPLAALGLLLGGTVGHALATVGLLLPGLLVHDAWRVAFTAHGRPDQAALIDGTWLLVQVGGVAGLLAVGIDSPVPYLLAWGLAATAAAALGVARGRVRPQVVRTWTWLSSHWDITRFLLFDAVLVQGAFQGALLLVGALGTLSAAGALRGAAVVLGPVSLLAMSAMSFSVPELARRRHMPARTRLAVASGIGALMGTASLAWGAVALLLPDQAGVFLLGDTWSGVEPVLLPTVIGQAANLFALGPVSMILAMAATRTVFRINSTLAVLLVVLGVGGVLTGGAVGAAYGFLIAYWLVMPLWFRSMWKLVRAGAADPVRPG